MFRLPYRHALIQRDCSFCKIELSVELEELLQENGKRLLVDRPVVKLVYITEEGAVDAVFCYEFVFGSYQKIRINKLILNWVVSLPASFMRLSSVGKIGGSSKGFWRNAKTKRVSEKFVIHLPGDELVSPMSLAHFLTVKIKGRTLLSSEPIMYKKSLM